MKSAASFLFMLQCTAGCCREHLNLAAVFFSSVISDWFHFNNLFISFSTRPFSGLYLLCCLCFLFSLPSIVIFFLRLFPSWEGEAHVCWDLQEGHRVAFGSGFFPSTMWISGLNSGCRIRWQMPLPSGPSYPPCWTYLNQCFQAFVKSKPRSLDWFLDSCFASVNRLTFFSP